VLSGIALGWLSHIRYVPGVWLIVASVVLLVIVAKIVAMMKKRTWVEYAKQVHVLVRTATVFLITVAFFTAHFFFTTFSAFQLYASIIGGVLSAIILYKQIA